MATPTASQVIDRLSDTPWELDGIDDQAIFDQCQALYEGIQALTLAVNFSRDRKGASLRRGAMAGMDSLTELLFYIKHPNFA